MIPPSTRLVGGERPNWSNAIVGPLILISVHKRSKLNHLLLRGQASTRTIGYCKDMLWKIQLDTIRQVHIGVPHILH